MCPPLRLGTSSLWAAKSCHTLALRRNAWVRTRAILTSDPLYSLGFPGGTVIKNLPAKAGDTGDAGLISGSGRSPGVGKWQHSPVFLPRKFHGQRSLSGYSPWDHTEHACS